MSVPLTIIAIVGKYRAHVIRPDERGHPVKISMHNRGVPAQNIHIPNFCLMPDNSAGLAKPDAAHLPVQPIPKPPWRSKIQIDRNRRYTATINRMHLTEGPFHDIAKENLDGVIHHFKIAGIKDNAGRITMPEANINAICEQLHAYTLPETGSFPAAPSDY